VGGEEEEGGKREPKVNETREQKFISSVRGEWGGEIGQNANLCRSEPPFLPKKDRSNSSLVLGPRSHIKKDSRATKEETLEFPEPRNPGRLHLDARKERREKEKTNPLHPTDGGGAGGEGGRRSVASCHVNLKKLNKTGSAR